MTTTQWDAIEQLWETDEDYEPLKVTWEFYQKLICIYDQRAKDGKAFMEETINTLRTGLPDGLDELTSLGRALWRRREDILA